MSKLRYLHLFILLVLGLIIYSKTFYSPFIYDDYWFILNNPQILDLSNFLDFSGTRYIGFLSFALNYAVGDFDLFGYNLVNILIHILNSILVYSLALVISRTPAIDKSRINTRALAFISALLFLAHPIETQAVSYLTQRFASLATLFYLLSLVLYIKARLLSPLAGKRVVRYFFYAASFVAAICAHKTKEISFTLPLIIVLFEFSFFPGADGALKRLKRLVPFLLTLVVIPISILAPKWGRYSEVSSAGDTLKVSQIADLTTISSYDYLMTQFRVIVTYLRLLVFPANQNLLYDYPLYNSFFAVPVFVSFLFLAAIFFSAVYLFVRSIRAVRAQSGGSTGLLISTGILWFFITLSVESSVIPIQHAIFEHRLYLPSVGFFIAVVAAFLYLLNSLVASRGERIASFSIKKTAWTVVVVLVLLLSALSYKRNVLWSDDLSLWKDVARKSPGMRHAQFYLAKAYTARDDKARAIEHFKEYLRLNNIFIASAKTSGDHEMAADITKELAPGYNIIAILYQEMNRFDDAIVYFKEAISRNPDYEESYYRLAVIYFTMGRYSDAVPYFKEAIRVNPLNDDSHFNLASTYQAMHDNVRAIKYYVEAVRLNPMNINARYKTGLIYLEEGRIDEAIKEFLEVVKRDPDYKDAEEILKKLNL